MDTKITSFHNLLYYDAFRHIVLRNTTNIRMWASTVHVIATKGKVCYAKGITLKICHIKAKKPVSNVSKKKNFHTFYALCSSRKISSSCRASLFGSVDISKCSLIVCLTVGASYPTINDKHTLSSSYIHTYILYIVGVLKVNSYKL